ncbi:MAG: hypothetical protein QW179_04175 [Candidatus Hadarchaeales archaeon]
MRGDERGFALSGFALLLILPAVLIGGTLLRVAAFGAESIGLQAVADKVFYAGRDIERLVRKTWDENILADNRPNANATILGIQENYRNNAGVVAEVIPTWKLWTRSENRPNPSGIRDSRAGTNYCKVARGRGDNWFYYFEAYQMSIDYNDIILRVSRGENLTITVVGFDPVVNWPIDVYYGDILLWDDVRRENIGLSTTVAGTIQLTVDIEVEDARGVARYSSSLSF